MADCVLNILDGLDPSCQALKKQGGLKSRVWIGNYDDIVTTKDGDGYVDAVVMTGSPVPQLYKFIGKDFKNNYALAGAIGENLNTINPTLNLLLYYFTPAERAAIEGLYNAEKLVVFVQGVGGEGKSVIEIFGLLNGLKASALAGGSGTNLNDSTAITVSLAGEETELPKVLKSGSFGPNESGYVQQNVDYLDALAA
jgi:hypothetical protein